MQIVRGGNVSRLHDLGKTLAIVKQFKTPCNKTEKANPRKPRKFSTANDLHYTVTYY